MRTLAGGLVALVLSAGGCGVPASKQAPADAPATSPKSAASDFRDKVLAVDLADEAALKAMKEEIVAKRALWRGKEIENDITSQIARINASLALIDKTRALADELHRIETELAAKPPGEQLAKLFAQVRDSELAATAAEAGGDYATRYDADVKAVTSTYVEVLRTAAKAAASATTGEGLAPFGALEDTLRTVLEAAQVTNDVETIKQYKDGYTQTVSEIDAVVAKLFDDAYIDKVAWKDLLADANAWIIAQSPTFVSKFGGGLTLENPERGQSGGLLYMPGGRWRDYVLELEVTLASGTLSVFTRVGDENKMDVQAVAGFTYGTRNTKYMAEYGKPHMIAVRVIGKTMTVYIDGAVQSPESLTLNQSRRGKPGLAITGGTSAQISKLRVRLLR